MTAPDLPGWLERAPARTVTDEARLRDAWRSRQQDGRTPDVPVWEVLSWVADTEGYLLHGSRDPSLAVLEPRAPVDLGPDDFSKRTAVFATDNALWAMFYALRGERTRSMLNTCVRAWGRTGWSGWHYFLSVSSGGPERAPDPRALLDPGWVYVVERADAAQMPLYDWPGIGRVEEPQFAIPGAAPTLARVRVVPDDLPLTVHGHDAARTSRLAGSDPGGFPWLTS